jgi:thiosulfate dehydrogenase [quinone] large subunit
MSETNSRQLKNSVAFLRVLIGWHFLYEGVTKLFNPDWTAMGYLAGAKGPFSWLFSAMANDSIIGVIDVLNWLALIIVGMTLILGIYERLGAIIGIALLAMYYLAHPPFPGIPQINVEGSYWLVNKNLIELAACIVLLRFPTGSHFGLPYIMNKKSKSE